MSWFSPKPSVDEEEREWIEDSMLRLADFFGIDRLKNHPTILPEPKFFPDRYEPTEEGAEKAVKRVCGYMGVDFDTIELLCFTDYSDVSKAHLTNWQSSETGAAGWYSHAGQEKFRISLSEKILTEPVKLVATIAHELGHVLLLGSGKIQRTEEDHEYLTDLLTVYFGFGIFTANAAFTFSQWQGRGSHGWSSSRQGYMSESMFGYALAAYCWMRGEVHPKWELHLATNVKHYFKGSMKFLIKTNDTRLPKG